MNSMIVREINSKSILSESKIFTYVINPYVGCQFGCKYCYARYMKKFTGHKEPWGEFVDVKINAADLLKREIKKKKNDRVWISGVCDPYQPLEAKYKLTRVCLEILTENDWPVVIQTKSKLVLRDVDIIKRNDKIDVGFSIGTADEGMRKLFEPNSPPIADRISALRELHDNGITTFAMIAPVLPGSDEITDLLDGIVDYIYVDRMNYCYANNIYKKNDLEKFLEIKYFNKVAQKIKSYGKKKKIECVIV